MWRVRYLPEAELELDALPGTERAAVRNAVEKLKALGPDLGYPHSSDVQEVQGVRELRPRQGRSPWRALYRRYGEEFVIAAICPEADQDQRGFRRGCAVALDRLADLKEG